MVLSTLLAHQGGWDEVLLVAAPIVVFGVLLTVANRRHHASEAPPEATDADPAGDARTEGSDEHDAPGTQDRD